MNQHSDPALERLIAQSHIKTIGVLTSGGDAPGMNAAVRAVVRAAVYYGCTVKGVYKGYQGLIDELIEELTTEQVSNIIQRGGTIIKTARCEAFRTPEGRQKAFHNLVKHNIDGLVVIGGDGSFRGAKALYDEFKFPVVGIPGTIDNDLFNTDLTIGYTTALNTIIESVDKIRDTASSHERVFFVEVMGRDSGYLALNGAVASGAEAVFIPEDYTGEEALERMINRSFRHTKNSSIVLVTEKDEGGAMAIAERTRQRNPNWDVRVTILGHLQRGGSPCATDRIIASRMGVDAVEALLTNNYDVMSAIVNDQIVRIPLEQAIKKGKPIKQKVRNILEILSL